MQSLDFGPQTQDMLLLPPILSEASAQEMALGVSALRNRIDLEVLPENPPGHVFIGDLHLLDFFGRLCELADTGMLLDVAHLKLYQKTMGYQPLEYGGPRTGGRSTIAGASRTEVEGPRSPKTTIQ